MPDIQVEKTNRALETTYTPLALTPLKRLARLTKPSPHITPTFHRSHQHQPNNLKALSTQVPQQPNIGLSRYEYTTLLTTFRTD